MTEKQPDRTLRCEACGASFGCFAVTGGCWCAEMQVPEDTRAELNAKYTECLCPACLASQLEERNKA
jgi:hypothetical protein